MIVEKLRSVKKHKELVAFAAKLDDVIPHTSNKLCICRDSDGRMFYVAHVFIFDEKPECQDPVILIIGDVDGYLKEGDDVSLVEEEIQSYSRHGRYQDDFYTRHDIPGGWWKGVGGEDFRHVPCPGYCQQCGKRCKNSKW